MRVEREIRVGYGRVGSVIVSDGHADLIAEPGKVYLEINQAGFFAGDYYAVAEFTPADLRRFLAEVLAALPEEVTGDA